MFVVSQAYETDVLGKLESYSMMNFTAVSNIWRKQLWESALA